MKIRDKVMWKKVESLGWAKDFDYNRIQEEVKKNVYESFSIQCFVKEKRKELVQAIEQYEKENEKLNIGSDDGFLDVTFHIVGLGEKEWKKAIKNPKLVEKRYNSKYGTKEGYKESFSYCFHS